MANEKNLNHKLTADEQRAGGKASGKKRREKRTQRELLEMVLNMDIGSIPALRKSAGQLGLDGNADLNTYLTIASIYNSAKKDGVSTLKIIAEMRGEEFAPEDTNKDVEQTLVKIKETAYADRDKQ